MLRKGKVYLLSREERKEVCKFIKEQLRKEYIKPLKSSQMVSMFSMIKQDSFFFFLIQQFITWCT